MHGMNILQKHTAQYFGTMQHGINRSGKVIYTARGAANSDLGLYANGKKVKRTTKTTLLNRILYR